MLSPALSLSLSILAAAATPPPWPEALACAAVTQAAAELSKDPVTGIPEATAFDVAIHWSLVAMDSARLAGMSARAAEADQKSGKEAARSVLTSGDGPTTARLADCTARTPPVQDSSTFRDEGCFPTECPRAGGDPSPGRG